MSNRGFRDILQRWDQRCLSKEDKKTLTISLAQSDCVKIKALAELYQLPAEAITTELLQQALNEVEEAMPYIEGSNVIRIEEGQEVYEDVGPTPKYIAILKKHR